MVYTPIFWSHLVKLINADNTPICQDHGSSFKIKLTLKCTIIIIDFSIKIHEGLVYDHISILSIDERHLLSNINNAGNKGLTVLLSWITEAVRPAADEPFPEV